MEYNTKKEFKIIDINITKQLVKNILINIQNHFQTLNLIGKIDIETTLDIFYSYNSLKEFQNNYVHNSEIKTLSIIFSIPDTVNIISHKSIYIRIDKYYCNINVNHTNQALAQDYLEEVCSIINSCINNDEANSGLPNDNNSKSLSSDNLVTVTYSKEEREHQRKNSKILTIQNFVIAVISAAIGALLNHFLTK